MHLAGCYDWQISGIDIENAFLEADIDKNIYMYLPGDVYKRPDGTLQKVKLNLSLYGLKQAGELFYQRLKEVLEAAGF